jgi:hypothetical protein
MVGLEMARSSPLCLEATVEMPEQIMARVNAAGSPQHDRGIIGGRNLTDDYFGPIGRDTFRLPGFARRKYGFLFRCHCLGSTDLPLIRAGIWPGTLPRSLPDKRKDREAHGGLEDAFTATFRTVEPWDTPRAVSRYGYTLMCERTGPKELVLQVRATEIAHPTLLSCPIISFPG